MKVIESQERTSAVPPKLELRFDAGTLLLEGAPETERVPSLFRWDARVRRWRAPAHAYREILTDLVRGGYNFKDAARRYHEFHFHRRREINLRPYQREAVACWREQKRRGVVVLPTGAGKTVVAEEAIAETKRSTLIVVPTIDLMNQWYDEMLAAFAAEIGLIGGGYFEPGAITITTYASAFRLMERLGDSFGLLIFDECHHLPSETFAYAAELAIAPFRLGLTATPERTDEGETRLTQLIGPIVYRREAQEFAGEYLAAYRTVRIPVELSAAERQKYEDERAIFRRFLQTARIDFSAPDGWRQFILASAQSQAGRRALIAYRESKRIALGTEAKLKILNDILQRHATERAIIFTAENEMVYRISKEFLIPAITHETPIKERREWLEAFNAGEVLAIATSKALNEGVNIPEASIAIVLSGSGSTREHIQRLGRILRPALGKQAILYEVVTLDTAEERISERRSNARQFQRRGAPRATFFE